LIHFYKRKLKHVICDEKSVNINLRDQATETPRNIEWLHQVKLNMAWMP